MRFRRLSDDELKRLEKDFVHFLAANTVTADDWVKLKETQIDKAEELINLFSDVVYEQLMTKVEYLEYRSSHQLRVFYCDKDVIQMQGLDVSKDLKIDLRKGETLKNVLSNNNIDGKVQVIHAEKAYEANREDEVFKMMINGCVKTDAKIFDLLSGLRGKL